MGLNMQWPFSALYYSRAHAAQPNLCPMLPIHTHVSSPCMLGVYTLYQIATFFTYYTSHCERLDELITQGPL